MRETHIRMRHTHIRMRDTRDENLGRETPIYANNRTRFTAQAPHPHQSTAKNKRHEDTTTNRLEYRPEIFFSGQIIPKRKRYTRTPKF